MSRRYASFLVLLCSFFATPFHAVASDAQGLPLGGGYVVQVNKVKCGYVSGRWIPGKILKTGNFLSTSTSISLVKKQLKNKKLKSAVKARLNSKLAGLKKSLKKNARQCSGLPGSGPTPVATPAVPLPDSTTVAWDVDAFDLSANVGSEYQYFCPPNSFGTVPTVYGHDIYTSDSSICVSAVHLGLFKRNTGGNVRIKMKGPQTFFYGSVRNGIESEFFGPFAGSYVFVNIGSGLEVLSGDVPQITWSRDAYRLYTYVGQQFTLACPPGIGQADSIWGTDIYTYDSSICTAAVHAGRISLAAGGVVVVLIQPGQSSYTGSLRHGINSSSYGSWGGSFSFLP